MSVEELLKPRFKVIADYPNNPYSVGWIMEYSQQEHPLSESGWSKLYNPYPHLFKPLAWYEERDVKDLPEYIECKENYNDIKCGFYKPLSWHIELGDTFFMLEGDKIGFSLGFPYKEVYPSTEQEYLTYVNTKE